jgi:hypothetical protein
MSERKLLSFKEAGSLIDPDHPPHRATMKSWPGFPKSWKPSGKVNGKEWIVRAESDEWLRKQTGRKAGAA